MYIYKPQPQRNITLYVDLNLDWRMGKTEIIVRALYGGKAACTDYWRHIRKAMLNMNFESFKAGPDVWIRSVAESNGSEYNQYIILYTDDIL